LGKHCGKGKKTGDQYQRPGEFSHC
jgi:hypothetical protein